MKELLLTTILCFFITGVFAQQLRPEIKDNSSLIQLRKELKYADGMMRQGIFTDEDTKREYFTGYAYKTLYDWDQYFESIVQIYMGWSPEYIKNCVTIFLDHQQDDGLISRSVPSNEYHDPEHLKPFLAQIALLVFDNYNDTDWFTDDYFNKMKKYIDHWYVDMDKDRNGLSEWLSAPHSGMDNQHERAGWWLDRISEGVDLNSYLVREARAFARIAEIMGKDKIAKDYRKKAEERAQNVRDMLWDEDDGFFYDRKITEQSLGNVAVGEKHLIKVKSVAGFMPMWAGIATREQAEELTFNHLLNPQEFWTNYPVPALAKSEPGYASRKLFNDLGCSWRANTWIPTNYMVYHGLKNYGYHQIARLVSIRTQQLLDKAGDREYYRSEDGGGEGLDPFWGWSLLGHFFGFEDNWEEDISGFSKQ